MIIVHAVASAQWDAWEISDVTRRSERSVPLCSALWAARVFLQHTKTIQRTRYAAECRGVAPSPRVVNLVLAADLVGEDVGALVGEGVEWGHRKRRRNCLWYPCARPWTRPSLPVSFVW